MNYHLLQKECLVLQPSAITVNFSPLMVGTIRLLDLILMAPCVFREP
jgi:hypothetical protein